MLYDNNDDGKYDDDDDDDDNLAAMESTAWALGRSASQAQGSVKMKTSPVTTIIIIIDEVDDHDGQYDDDDTHAHWSRGEWCL